MAWYKTGTITVTNGSTTVTGSGTQFITNVAIGEALYAPDGRLYEITNIASDTAFTITPAYLGSTAAGQDYVIVPSQSYIRDLAAQAADLVNNYSTIANFAGQGKFGDGTLTAPGIRYSDDLDTGFFRSAANEVTFVAGGVAQFKYNTSGISFVGGSGIDLTTFSIDGTTVTASGAELNLLDGATITTAELNVLDGITATTAELNYTDGVTSNIQTQLNTKAPSADPTFTGDLEYTGTLTGGTGVINIGSGQVYKDASGNVGIGTTNAVERLVVSRLGNEPSAIPTLDPNTAALFHSGTTSASSGASLTLLGGNSSFTGINFADTDDGDVGQIAYVHSQNVMTFKVNDAEAARITSSGNVGIGTSSPNMKLHIAEGSSGVSSFSLSADDLLIERNSNAGITIASPNTNSGNIAFADPQSANAGVLQYSHSSNHMAFWTNAEERMRITSAGVVEINSGYVTLNGNQIGGIQVTIADDAFAEITPPRSGAGFVTVTTNGEAAFPDSSCAGIAYVDYGSSPAVFSVHNNGNFEISTAGPPTGTTGTDARATLFAGGTSGKLYLENRRGQQLAFQLTFT